MTAPVIKGDTMRTTTHLLGAAAAVALIAGTASAAPAATRAGGGIFWAAPTCEVAVHNASDDAVDVLLMTDQNLHSGIVLRDNQPPLALYDGLYEKSMLLGRVAKMPDPPESGTVQVPAGATASFATGCTSEQMWGLGPNVFATDPETGEFLRMWGNTYWPGHTHDSTGNVLLTYGG